MGDPFFLHTTAVALFAQYFTEQLVNVLSKSGDLVVREVKGEVGARVSLSEHFDEEMMETPSAIADAIVESISNLAPNQQELLKVGDKRIVQAFHVVISHFCSLNQSILVLSFSPIATTFHVAGKCGGNRLNYEDHF